jgi:hypothetical protein
MSSTAASASSCSTNVACLVPNPEPKRREVRTFEMVAELEAVGVELGAAYRGLPCSSASPG